MWRVRRGQALPVILLALGVAWAGPVDARTVTTLLDAAGDGTGPRALLERPYDVAVDSTGNVFVPSPDHDLVLRVTPAGAVSVILDATGDGGGHVLANPASIAVDSLDNVYVAGWASSNVFKITPGGTVSEVIDASGDGGANVLSVPVDLAVDPSDGVYVVGRSSQNLFHVTAAGSVSVVTSWPSEQPEHVAADPAGGVYVTTDLGGAGRLLHVTLGGVETEIETGSNLDEVGDLIVDLGGNPIVSYLAGNVVRSDPGGGSTLLYQSLDRPWGLAVDSANNVYVAVSDDNQVRKRDDVTGAVTTVLTYSSSGVIDPRPLAIDSTDDLYVAGLISNDVFRVTPAGLVTEIVHRNWDTSAHPLEGPIAVAVDAARTVFALGQGSANLFRRFTDGTIDVVLDVTGDGLGNEIRRPSDLVLDDAGNAYVADDFTGTLLKITPAATVTALIDSQTGPPPSALATDPAGNVYVASTYADQVVRIDPGGAATVLASISGPRAIDAAPDGRVYVATWGGPGVYRIDPGGTVTQLMDASGDGAGHPLRFPEGVVVDSVGTVTVADFECVFRIASDGSISVPLEGSSGQSGVPFFGPRSLAVDAADSVWVRAQNGIWRITRNGDVSFLLSTGDAMGGIAVDRTGDVYAATFDDDEVFALAYDCPDTPLSGCKTTMLAGKSRLSTRDKTPERKDSLRWSLPRAEATSLGELGDPLNTDDYRFCVYEESGVVPFRLLEAVAAAGGTCGVGPCWRDLGPKGLKFIDKDAVGGIRKLTLKPGDAGAAKIVTSARGEPLLLPAAPYALPVRAQLQAANGTCWEATYSAPRKNDAAQFKAKSD